MKRLIFGCGYLGSRVGSLWLEQEDSVYAFTRREERARELAELGYEPLLGDITESETIGDLPEVDTILFAVGMDRSRYDNIRDVYVDGLQNVLKRLEECGSLKSLKHFVYVSSTGVYGDFGGDWINETAETNPTREGGKACVEAEQLIADSPLADRATILRFAGIYGPDRVPTRDRIEAKAWNKLSSAGYLNLIHVHDGAGIIKSVAEQFQQPNCEIFNVSDGAPSLRRDYYDFVSQQLGLGEIPWGESDSTDNDSRASSSKRVSNEKLMNGLNYEFQYPDYRSGLIQAFEATKPN